VVKLFGKINSEDFFLREQEKFDSLLVISEIKKKIYVK